MATKCSLCQKRRKVNEYGLCSECQEHVDYLNSTAYQMKRAHEAVRRAVRNAELKHVSKCKCIECGGQAEEYHHPNGYNFPLNVVPVCKNCHKKMKNLDLPYDTFAGGDADVDNFGDWIDPERYHQD